MTIECRHSRDAVICDPEALEGKLLPPMNEYEEADQAEWNDQADYLRKQPPPPARDVFNEVTYVLAVLWVICAIIMIFS